MEDIGVWANWVIITLNCSAVAIICYMLSRWLRRIEKEISVMDECFDEILLAIKRCNFNAIGIHIENMRIQFQMLSQKEEYEAMAKLKEELDRSLVIYNKLEQQLKEADNGRN